MIVKEKFLAEIFNIKTDSFSDRDNIFRRRESHVCRKVANRIRVDCVIIRLELLVDIVFDDQISWVFAVYFSDVQNVFGIPLVISFDQSEKFAKLS